MSESDKQLLEAILAGDRDSYRLLVDRYTPGLFRLAYRITNDRSDAEEVLQESFLRAYQQLGNFELRSDFGTWIYRITANCALNFLQKERGTKVRSAHVNLESADFHLATGAASPERLAYSRQIADQRDLAMKNLTEVERAAFVLRHLEERSLDEVADVLGMTVNSAKQAVFRSVQKMRRALEPLWVKQ